MPHTHLSCLLPPSAPLPLHAAATLPRHHVLFFFHGVTATPRRAARLFDVVSAHVQAHHELAVEVLIHPVRDEEQHMGRHVPLPTARLRSIALFALARPIAPLVRRRRRREAGFQLGQRTAGAAFQIRKGRGGRRAGGRVVLVLSVSGKKGDMALASEILRALCSR